MIRAGQQRRPSWRRPTGEGRRRPPGLLAFPVLVRGHMGPCGSRWRCGAARPRRGRLAGLGLGAAVVWARARNDPGLPCRPLRRPGLVAGQEVAWPCRKRVSMAASLRLYMYVNHVEAPTDLLGSANSFPLAIVTTVRSKFRLVSSHRWPQRVSSGRARWRHM